MHKRSQRGHSWRELILILIPNLPFSTLPLPSPLYPSALFCLNTLPSPQVNRGPSPCPVPFPRSHPPPLHPQLANDSSLEHTTLSLQQESPVRSLMRIPHPSYDPLTERPGNLESGRSKQRSKPPVPRSSFSVDSQTPTDIDPTLRVTIFSSSPGLTRTRSAVEAILCNWTVPNQPRGHTALQARQASANPVLPLPLFQCPTVSPLRPRPSPMPRLSLKMSLFLSTCKLASP